MGQNLVQTTWQAEDVYQEKGESNWGESAKAR